MNADGQVYFAPEDELPAEDKDRLERARLEEALREQVKRYEDDLRRLADG